MPTKITARDPFLDIVRSGAILLVVFQHWLVPVLSRNGDELVTGNAYATPGWWVLTWIGQVMPLVFFAGGAANLLAYRTHLDRGGCVRDWLSARVFRLTIPLLPLMALWLPLPTLLVWLGVPEQPVQVGGAVAAQLLWFMAVYLASILLTPVMVALHRRFGLGAVAALVAAALLVDFVRFGPFEDAGMVAFANALIVWLAVHQLGFVYAEGRLGEFSPRAGLVLAVVGFGVTALMVAFGPYPASMIGMPGAPVSNAGPPTACLISLACGQIGLLLMARPLLVRMFSRPGAAAVLGWVGARCMTLYLWHMTALVAIGGAAVFAFGYVTPEPGTLTWFAVTPLWLCAALAALLLLVRLFGRFEAFTAVRSKQRSKRAAARRLPSLAQVSVATAALAVGVLGLAASGFASDAPGDDYPLVSTAAAIWCGVVVLGFVCSRYPVTVVGAPMARLYARVRS